MKWIIDYFTSSIGQKIIMGLSGLFLCLFLVIHLAGNVQLFFNDNGEAFNLYAQTMASNPLIQFASKITFAAILLHAIQGILLYLKNKKAKGQSYEVKTKKNASFAARNMALLGTILLVFIVVHLSNFWYEMKFGEVGNDAFGNKDLYTVVAASFQELWLVALYVISMLALSYHMYHGFQSGFQTLGINHRKYTPLIKWIGIWIFAIIIPLAFAAMPLSFYIKSVL